MGRRRRDSGRARPAPPDGVGAFGPAPELTDWIFRTFILPGGALTNPEHGHLSHARLGALWATVPCVRRGVRAVGMAERPEARGHPWVAGRAEFQLEAWFGFVPDFLLTFDAVWWGEVSDATACALVEHELYHCGQARDRFGAPRFTKEGRPVFELRGHDVEEFVGVVRRYGAGAAAGRTAELVQAAALRPEVAAADIAGACGLCVGRSALTGP